MWEYIFGLLLIKPWKNRSASLSVRPIISGAESFLAGTASCRIEVDEIDKFFNKYKMHGVIYSTDKL